MLSHVTTLTDLSTFKCNFYNCTTTHTTVQMGDKFATRLGEEQVSSFSDHVSARLSWKVQQLYWCSARGVYKWVALEGGPVAGVKS